MFCTFISLANACCDELIVMHTPFGKRDGDRKDCFLEYWIGRLAMNALLRGVYIPSSTACYFHLSSDRCFVSL
jgi:hypothetical protein